MPPFPRYAPASCVTVTSGMHIIVQRNNRDVTSFNMADERSSKINKTRHCEVERIALNSNPEKLRINLLGRTEPAVFDGAASQWACSEWTPEFLALELGDLRTRFRFCTRQNSSVDGNPCKKTIMETDCEFEKASFEEFIQWLNGCTERSGCLSRFQR